MAVEGLSGGLSLSLSLFLVSRRKVLEVIKEPCGFGEGRTGQTVTL